MELEDLKDWLDTLIQRGVANFECPHFSVTFLPKEPKVAPITERPPHKTISSMWEEPSLWPGGEPPKFKK